MTDEAGSSARAEGRRSLSEDWKSSPRAQKALMIAIAVMWGLAAITHLVTWATHRPPLRPEAVIGSMLVMLGLVIWHCWIVKGWKQTVAFFLIAWIISWFCEFIGHNWGWFFGNYKYTDTLGVRIGGVPVVIIVTWSLVIYSAFMLLDWLLGLRGVKRGVHWYGKVLWAALVAAASATLVCAWDLMVDPMATSWVWQYHPALEGVPTHLPWWHWTGGPYLQYSLRSWQGKRTGIPIGNFVGWWLAPFFIVFIFYLIFQNGNRINDKLINVSPLFTYAFVYFAVVIVVLEMNWVEPGMTQVALIGTFTMMPIIFAGLLKLAKTYAPGTGTRRKA